MVLTSSLHENSSLIQLELSEEFQTYVDKELLGYVSIRTRVKCFTDFTQMSLVDLGGKEVDGELLGN